ncbi:hypothetical protein KSP40_PGU003690 [Platanthera guangdongensis]|uniref:Uncharacterized protein n=1 Tax=Platanthera guangdongensis TaxID=2320717 RepID=A0ABR2LMU5_9ASPA
MAPLLRGLIRRFLASRISNPNPQPPSKNASSYSYLRTLGAIDSTKLRENGEDEAATSAKYDLESIPGL